MGSLISYSGISTKVKAMERFRIRPEQFEAIDLGSVPEAVQFLRGNPSYERHFPKLLRMSFTAERSGAAVKLKQIP